MNHFYSNHMGLLGYLAKEFRSAAQIEDEPDRFAHLANQVERLMQGLEEAANGGPEIRLDVPA